MSAKRGRRPPSPGMPDRQELAEVIRVDHAGEYGAMRIYDGQLAVLGKNPRHAQTVASIRRMAAQEKRHLETFDRLVNERRVRPTVLSPLWHAAGFALGAATALLGAKAAMACTASVEEVIDEHYARQADLLKHDPELRITVEKFRNDEIAHKNEALAQGAAEAPAYRLLSESIKTGCRLAIRLSKKL